MAILMVVFILGEKCLLLNLWQDAGCKFSIYIRLKRKWVWRNVSVIKSMCCSYRVQFPAPSWWLRIICKSSSGKSVSIMDIWGARTYKQSIHTHKTQSLKNISKIKNKVLKAFLLLHIVKSIYHRWEMTIFVNKIIYFIYGMNWIHKYNSLWS